MIGRSEVVPLNNDPLWVPRSYGFDPQRGSARDRGVTVYDMYEGRSIRQTTTQDLRNKSFRVDGALSLDEAMEAPGVPLVGEAHPLNPYLLVIEKNGEVLGPDHYRVNVAYDYPKLGDVSQFMQRVRWSIGVTMQRWDTDIDGVTIGERLFWNKSFDAPQIVDGDVVVDGDAVFGLDAEVPDVTLEVAAPQGTGFDIAVDSTYWFTVNDRPFFGLIAGSCKYVGAQTEMIGSTTMSVVRMFRASLLQVPEPFRSDIGGATMVGPEYAPWFKYALTTDKRRVATQLKLARMCRQSNFDNLIAGM